MRQKKKDKSGKQPQPPKKRAPRPVCRDTLLDGEGGRRSRCARPQSPSVAAGLAWHPLASVTGQVRGGGVESDGDGTARRAVGGADRVGPRLWCAGGCGAGDRRAGAEERACPHPCAPARQRPFQAEQ